MSKLKEKLTGKIVPFKPVKPKNDPLLEEFDKVRLCMDAAVSRFGELIFEAKEEEKKKEMKENFPVLKKLINSLLSGDKESQDRLLFFAHCMVELNSSGHYISRDYLIENALTILSHSAWKVSQLQYCLSEFQSDITSYFFMTYFLPKIGERVYWNTFVSELNNYEEDYVYKCLAEDLLAEYLIHFNETVMLAEEAVYKYGLVRYPQLIFGKDMPIEIGKEDSFHTNSSGKIVIPPYVNTFQSKEENSLVYLILFHHEMGHHLFRTFDVNLDPRIFDYQAFRVRYLRHTTHKGQLEITVEREGTEIKVNSFAKLLYLVKYPILLHFLHNIVDDGRIDANNIERFSGIAEDYRQIVEKHFEKRCKLEHSDLGTFLEAMLQYAIVGKTRNEVPAGLKAKFNKARKIMNEMDFGPETDGTDSMNVAIKLYNLVLEDFEQLVKNLSERELPESMMNSSTDSGKAPNLIMKDPPCKKQKRRPGVNPFDLINNDSEPGDNNGEDVPLEPTSEPNKKKNPENSSGEEGEEENKPGKKSDKKPEENDDEPKAENGSGEEGEKEKKPEKTGDNNPAGANPYGNLKTGEQGDANRNDRNTPTIFYYDGWDGFKQVFEEHRVEQLHADGKLLTYDPAEEEKIRRTFRKYAPKTGVLVRGTEDGDIDPELLSQYFLDLRAGKLEDMNFYQRVLYEQRDVATMVLVDLSGSALIVKPQILDSCAVLGVASDTLHDPLLIAGFSGDLGDEKFIVMKGIHEKDITSSEYSSNTPLGGPLRHCSYLMGNVYELKCKGFKQLFVITDGAANVGKNPVEDAKKAVEEAWKKYRINVMAFGILNQDGPVSYSEMEKYLESVFGAGNYFIITDKDVDNKFLHHYFERYYRKQVNKVR
ncbi:MAG: hypothetical protein WC501_00830 [Candidatus Micrarchaeia archaeon]